MYIDIKIIESTLVINLLINIDELISIDNLILNNSDCNIKAKTPKRDWI